MGSASSKASRAAPRKFPTRSPGPSVTQSRPQPKQAPKGDGSKDAAVEADAMDPDFTSAEFSRRLSQMGVVQPNPTYSPSSTVVQHPDAPPAFNAGPVFPSTKNNVTLAVLEARKQLQRQADEDMEAVNEAGNQAVRRFLDMRTLIDAIQLLDRGHSSTEVEKKLGLQPKLLSKLGKQGVLTHLAN